MNAYTMMRTIALILMGYVAAELVDKENENESAD